MVPNVALVNRRKILIVESRESLWFGMDLFFSYGGWKLKQSIDELYANL